VTTANGRIPAIVDRTGERERVVFESGALMLYLCQRYDKEGRISYPFDSDR
jgi:glutathione S-transferase